MSTNLFGIVTSIYDKIKFEREHRTFLLERKTVNPFASCVVPLYCTLSQEPKDVITPIAERFFSAVPNFL